MKRIYTLYIAVLLGLIGLPAHTSLAAGVSLGVYTSPDTDNNATRSTREPNAQALAGIEFHFRLDDSQLDLNYMGNDVSLRNFSQKIDSIGIHNIDSVVVVSQSSPEGVYEYNVRLSQRRANAMYTLLSENFPQLKSRLIVHPDGEAWDALREYVVNDTEMTEETRQKVLDIIDSDINIGTKKWRMQRLPIYQYLLKTYYPRIRNSVSCILYTHLPKFEIAAMEVPETTADIKIVTPPLPTDTVPLFFVGSYEWVRHLYVKTNFAAWGLAISNAAVEVDVAPHWSVALPIYYSAWNYGSITLKFRTFGVMPEARYWLSPDNVGFFVGAHAGFAFYNFAFNGDFRYQDHAGASPAWGGGLNVGYRLALDKPQRWHLEFELGAGVYDLYYDTFFNVYNGQMYKTYKDTYVGIDNVGITLSYRFDLNKKGGKR